MVKETMKKQKRKFGFSIVEALILITVLAIAVAATTPIITRKLINNSDIGAALGGGSHGRYEIYTKEVLTFGPNRTPQDLDGSKNITDFKKEKNPSVAQNTIIVYEKKDKNFYKKMTGKNPVESTGKTSTLYEEIKGVTAVVNEDGTITQAKKNVNGKVETYVAGSKYIFEDGTYKYTSNTGTPLDTSKNRIIEGNLTSKFNKNNPDTNNTLWELTVKDENDAGGGVVGYEKVTDPSIKGDLIIYEKKDDTQYKVLTGSNPSVSGEYKSTLYEEITDVKPIKDKDGTITAAKIKVNGKETVVKDDSKYIFENPQVTYVKGIVKVVNGITTFIPDEDGKTIDRNKNRVIEGNLTDKYNKNNPQTNNPLWHIQASSNNFDGDVTTIPWEKVISGSKEIVNRPIHPNSNGDYVGEFTPPATAVNTVLHAVGGGGAGGGPSASTLDAYVNPKIASTSEINIMKKQLAKRFREVAKKKGLDNLAALSDNDIVQVVSIANLDTANRPSDLLYDNKYILLNTYNGTITVKFDVTTGMILPHELLDYTKILGAQTQIAEIHDMPKWFDWQNVTDGKFKAGAVACGGAGGRAGTFTWNINDKSDEDINCMRDEYGRYTNTCTKRTSCRYRTGQNCYEYTCNKEKCVRGSCRDVKSTCEKCVDTYDWAYNVCVENIGTCANTQYYTCNTYELTSSCPNEPGTCDDSKRERNSTKYSHIYKGGNGGAAPPCVWLSSIVTKPIEVKNYCVGVYSSYSGNDVTKENMMNEPVDITGINGKNGKTCAAVVDGVVSLSQGGMGGIACVQSQFENSVNGNLSDQETDTAQFNDKLLGALGGAFGLPVYKDTNSTITMKYQLDQGFLCETVPNNIAYCGKDGKNGVARPGSLKSNMCSFSSGASEKCMSGGQGRPNPSASNSYGIGGSTGRYNYFYTWTIPYGTNYLGYGEAGSAGEYASTKLSKIEGSLFIKLGKGGEWTNSDWKNGKKGPNGTDTVVKMGTNNVTAKKVLVAKGGQGGRGNLKTNNYDLCYANDRNKACSDNANVQCCSGIAKTSREVSATNVRHSLFETIKSFVGNSKIIGIGLGRGAQGAGTTSGEFEVYGSRLGINASADSSFNNKIAERIVYKRSSAAATTGSKENTSVSSVDASKYKNKYLKPANVNFKGGDGAVIITW